MASLQDDSWSKFNASSLAKWFHSAPHKDFDLGDSTTIFSPSDKSYREALYLLAIFIASFGVLLFLINVLFWTCCYYICRKPKARRENQSETCCTKSCLQFQIFILALICSGAVAVGFVYNGKTSDGVDQLRNSIDDIQDNINHASTMGRQMKTTLQEAREMMERIPDLPEKAFVLTDEMISNLSAVNNLLPQHVVNESSEAGDKVHKYDNYRWLATVILLSWCIFLCLFLFWIACQVNGCILIMATIFGLLTLLFTWAVIGADFGICTGVGDFCVHPKQAVQKIKKGHETSIVISYFMDCQQYNPFKNKLVEFQNDIDHVISIIEGIPGTREVVDALNRVNANLSIYQAYFPCDKIHKEYMNAMDGLCGKALNSLSLVLLAVFVIAFFSGILTCCVCPLWKHRLPRPTTYSDIRNPRDDVGNSVLWWPHDIDAQHNRADERSPLIVNQHRPNFDAGNQPNVNFIHVDYHHEPRTRENLPSGNRHSF